MGPTLRTFLYGFFIGGGFVAAIYEINRLFDWLARRRGIS